MIDNPSELFTKKSILRRQVNLNLIQVKGNKINSCDVVIIAQIAYVSSGDREKSIELGCDDYIISAIKKSPIIVFKLKAMDAAQNLFDQIWKDYVKQNPEVKRIHDLFIGLDESVANDHIAFRTFSDTRVNIEVLSKVFIDVGYEYRGEYHFKEKHLYARHFELKGFHDAPRVFISELKLEEMSLDLQASVKGIIDKIPKNLFGKPEFIFSGNSWGKPSYKQYELLRKESEYAAWVYVFGYRANHFTVSINALKKLNTIQKVNQFLKDEGFLLNTMGGEIKGNPKDLLEQSSTKASLAEIEFEEGTYKIPTSYYEFARRYPAKDGKLYGGFIAQSANKIFESTDFYKKE